MLCRGVSESRPIGKQPQKPLPKGPAFGQSSGLSVAILAQALPGFDVTGVLRIMQPKACAKRLPAVRPAQGSVAAQGSAAQGSAGGYTTCTDAVASVKARGKAAMASWRDKSNVQEHDKPNDEVHNKLNVKENNKVHDKSHDDEEHDKLDKEHDKSDKEHGKSNGDNIAEAAEPVAEVSVPWEIAPSTWMVPSRVGVLNAFLVSGFIASHWHRGR